MKKDTLFVLGEYKKRLLNDKAVGDIFHTRFHNLSKNLVNLYDLITLSNNNITEIFSTIKNRDKIIIEKPKASLLKESIIKLEQSITKAKTISALEKNLEIIFKDYPIYKYSKYLRVIFDIFIKNEKIDERIAKLSKTISSDIDSIFLKFFRIVQDGKTFEFEKNANPLYVGWPHFEGSLSDGKKFRAPLLLWQFSVREKSTDFFSLNFKNENIMLNPAIRLSQIKAKNLSLNNYNFEPIEYTDSIFVDAFNEYVGLGLSWKNSLNEYLEKINQEYFYLKNKETYKDQKDDIDAYFRKLYKQSDARIVFEACIGMYNVSSTSLYQDYSELEKVTDDSVDKIFANNFSVDEDWEESRIEYQKNFSEKDVITISGSDISQKIAIKKALNKHTIIQGPPGTGKSSTITNLITNNLVNNERVLFCAEKQDAIKVVYDNLQILQKYSLVITNVDNMDYFYNQIAQAIKNLHFIRKEPKVIAFNEEIDGFFEDIQNYKTFATTPVFEIYAKFSNDVMGSNLLNYMNEIDFNLIKRIPYFTYNADVFETFVGKIFHNIQVIQKGNNLKKMFNLLSEIYLDYNKKQLQKIIKLEKTLSDETFTVLLFNLIDNKKVETTIKPFEQKDFEEFILKNKDFILEARRQFYKSHQFFEYSDIYDEYLELQTEQLFSSYKYIADIVNSEEDLIVLHKLLFIEKFEKENNKNLKLGQAYWIKELDELYSKNSRNVLKYLDYVIHKIVREKAKAEYDSEISILLDQCTRKNRKRIVTFFKSNYNLLQKMFPVIMTTPDIASQLLPLQQNEFDQLIFDEASQIFVEKAIPIIYRAKRLLVAGDDKQLPPTNFFGAKFDYENDENFAAVKEAVSSTLIDKSLLDFVNKLYNVTMLRFHYRSKYSELINFSNAAFYNNKLTVVSNKTNFDLPLEVINVETGIYENRGNIEEAKEVVKLLDKIIKSRKHKETIGVVTFNETQKNLILDEIYNSSDKYPAIDQEFFREENGKNIGLFVKNIENVQGDERDIIIFSIGFAKNNKGKFSQFFGPINLEGGENRLNVAITRAKSKIYVIKSISSSLISENSKNAGPKLFKYYLEYAEQLNMEEGKPENILDKINSEEKEELSTTRKIKSPNQVKFINQVYEEILEKIDLKKYDVVLNLEQGSYIIDVAIFDKKRKQYIVGIDCDNLKYQPWEETKEIDYYRQKYLIIRGWKIVKVLRSEWSILNRRENIVNNILELIKR